MHVTNKPAIIHPLRDALIAALAISLLAYFLAAYVILTDRYAFRPSEDQKLYHLPAIRQFSAQFPHPNLKDYSSATTPGYHLTLAAVDRFVSHDLHVLRLMGALFSVGLLATVAAACGRRAGWGGGVLLCLPILGSTYVFSSMTWLLPDNAGWWMMACVLLIAQRRRVDRWTYLLGGLAMVGVVLIRQSNLWVAAPLLVAAWCGGEEEEAESLHSAPRPPTELRLAPAPTPGLLEDHENASVETSVRKPGVDARAKRGDANLAGPRRSQQSGPGLPPSAIMRNLIDLARSSVEALLFSVPHDSRGRKPRSDSARDDSGSAVEFHPADPQGPLKRTTLTSLALLPALALLAWFTWLWHGLQPLSQKPLVSGVNPACPIMALAVAGCFGPFFLPLMLHRVTGIRWIRLAGFSALIGACIASVVRTSYDYDAGRYSGIWNIARRLPTIHGRSPFMIALAAVGCAVISLWLAALSRRERCIWATTAIAFGTAQFATHNAFQRYDEPMILIAAALSLRNVIAGAPRWGWIGPITLATGLAGIGAWVA